MKKKEDISVVLNELLKVNNDRIEIYRRAIKEINEHDLKLVFESAIEESKKIEAVLTLEIFKRNSVPDVDGTTRAGELYRFWLGVREFFNGKDYNSIVKGCKFVEYSVQKTYRKALQHEGLSLELSKILKEQTVALRKWYWGLGTYRVIKTLGSFCRINGTMAKA